MWQESIVRYHQPADHNEHYNSDDFENYVDNIYSPSEKYDLLVGDTNYTLTNSMKNEGNKYQKNGEVSSWMGYCNGWTPASYLFKRPNKTVTITAADGKTKIRFLQEDIKALITLFWGESSYSTRFVGNVCNYPDMSKVKRDIDTLLWMDPNCFSLNPASFFIVLGNHVGINGKNLIFEPQQGNEVWNQPFLGYNFTYYNIISEQQSDDFQSSLVTVDQLANQNNKFLQFLLKNINPNAVYLIGINMTVDYMVEIYPPHEDKVAPDEIYNTEYKFVLELDSNYNVIGGEWTSNLHPSFIWTTNVNKIILSEEDKQITNFGGSVDELIKLKDSAISASSKSTVLKVIADYLVKQSSQ